MQRHKQSLEFLESPYRGSKRFLSPTLAARRPYLAPSVQAEDLNTKWVSPQFQVDESGISKSLINKRRRVATRRQKAKQATIPNQTIENALFPELDFASSDQNGTGSQQSEIIQSKTSLRTRSKRINRDTRSGMAQSSSQRRVRKDKKSFLFSLGSPRTPIVSGEILVPETPVEQIAANHIKRLRPKEKTNLKQKK